MSKYSIVEIPAYTSETTGKSYPARNVMRTAVELLTIGQEWEKNVNENGNQFIICNIKAPRLDDNGEFVTTALCYEGNYNPAMRKDESFKDEMKVGQHYLATLSFDDEGKPYMQLSHLPAANQISDSDLVGIREMFAAQGFELPEAVKLRVLKAEQAKTSAPKADTEQEQPETANAETAGTPANA